MWCVMLVGGAGDTAVGVSPPHMCVCHACIRTQVLERTVDRFMLDGRFHVHSMLLDVWYQTYVCMCVVATSRAQMEQGSREAASAAARGFRFDRSQPLFWPHDIQKTATVVLP